jgi:hypothetical protein
MEETLDASRIFVGKNARYCATLYDAFNILSTVKDFQNCYRLDGAGIESQWEQISSTRPDRPLWPPIFLYIGNQDVIPGCGFSAEVKERVELHLFSHLCALMGRYVVFCTGDACRF